jgi:hypothetical protein
MQRSLLAAKKFLRKKRQLRPRQLPDVRDYIKDSDILAQIQTQDISNLFMSMQHQLTASEEARRKEEREYSEQQKEELRLEREQRAEEERQYRERQAEEERKFRWEIEEERRKEREERDKEREEEKQHRLEFENQMFDFVQSISSLSPTLRNQTPKGLTEDEQTKEEDTKEEDANEEEGTKEEDAKEEGTKEEVKQKEASQSPPLPPAQMQAQSSESGHQRSEEQDKEKRHVSGKKPAGKTLPQRSPSPPPKRSRKPTAKPGTPGSNKTKLPPKSDPS